MVIILCLQVQRAEIDQIIANFRHAQYEISPMYWTLLKIAKSETVLRHRKVHSVAIKLSKLAKSAIAVLTMKNARINAVIQD